MNQSDFFTQIEDPEWELKGLDPWTTREAFNTELVSELRAQPKEGTNDVDAAYGLAQLAHDQLEHCGTDGVTRLDDEEIALVIRSLRSVLSRLHVSFEPPFRDFKGFRGYWSSHDMSGPGGWGMRRGYLTELFNPVFSQLEQLEDEQTSTAVRGVDGHLKNVIFASTGPKPKIVLRDAINNVIEVVENAETCLFYDRPLTDSGLSWGELVAWWRAMSSLNDQSDAEVGRNLYRRLAASLASEPERTLFRTYCARYGREAGDKQPALLPQVYLHYDPRTRKERGGQPSILMRERMDFLLLLPHGIRIVLEVDGKQHYAEEDTASPKLYSEMVAEDRKLRLRGYDVYRFGGYELTQTTAADMLQQFFDGLHARYE
jgi:hypothetical protein